MRVIPVLDILAGAVVRGIAGRRAEYRPIVSRLTTSVAPVVVADAFRTHFGLSTLYVADLDAIAGQAPAAATYQEVRRQGFTLWVDAGVRHAAQAAAMADLDVSVVVGLETIAGPEELATICATLAPRGQRVIFSLDMKEGRPLTSIKRWQKSSSEEIAAEAVAAGVSALIVLDLARVGVGEGTGTEALCRRLRAAHPHIKLIAGGGVRHLDDLRRLADAGVDAALVASALHDGRLTAADLNALSS